MKFHSFLIKYGEIGIKGKNRYMFEDALVRQIRYALSDVDGDFYVHKCHGRVYVDCNGEYDYEDTVESLSRVFGIVGICPVVRREVKEIEELKKDVVVYMGEMYPEGNCTFKVEARRANKRYPMNSMEINCALGEAVLEAFPEMKVDVHNPDVRLNVEIREEVYLYSEIIPGPGGMPVGTNGSAMLLLSGGRIHDRKERCGDRSGIFPRPSVYKREGKRKGDGSGKARICLFRLHQAPCGKLHGYPALYL